MIEMNRLRTPFTFSQIPHQPALSLLRRRMAGLMHCTNDNANDNEYHLQLKKLPANILSIHLLFRLMDKPQQPAQTSSLRRRMVEFKVIYRFNPAHHSLPLICWVFFWAGLFKFWKIWEEVFTGLGKVQFRPPAQNSLQSTFSLLDLSGFNCTDSGFSQCTDNKRCFCTSYGRKELLVDEITCNCHVPLSMTKPQQPAHLSLRSRMVALIIRNVTAQHISLP